MYTDKYIALLESENAELKKRCLALEEPLMMIDTSSGDRPLLSALEALQMKLITISFDLYKLLNISLLHQLEMVAN